MAINLFANQENGVIALATKTWAELGFDNNNIVIVYELGNSLLSWKPLRSVNSLETGVVSGNSYIVIPKINMDVSAYFLPPIDEGGVSDEQLAEVLESAKAYTDEAVGAVSGGVLNVNTGDSPSAGVNNYNANTTGTYTNFSAISVSEEDMNSGLVQIRRVGETSVFEKIILPIAENIVYQNQFSGLLEQDVSADVALVSYGFPEGLNLTQPVTASTTFLLNDSYDFPTNGFIRSVKFPVRALGDVEIFIGSWSGAGFTKRVSLGVISLEETGVFKTAVFDYIPVIAGEYVAFSAPSGGSAAGIGYNNGAGGFQPGTHHVVATASALTSLGGNSTYFPMEITYTEEYSVLSNTLIRKDALPDQLEVEADKNNTYLPPVTVGFGLAYDATGTSYPDPSYALNDAFAESDGMVTTIRYNAPQVGDLVMAIGAIDQNGIFRETKELTFEMTVVGLNTVMLSEPIKAGQTLALKTPITCGSRAKLAGGIGKYWSTGAGYNSVLVDNNGYLTYDFDVSPLYETPFATRSEFLDATNSINSFKVAPPNLYTEDGRKVRMVISNDLSSFSFIDLTIADILILGNSIAKHPITSYWWGVWGMAASERDRDFAHILQAKVAVDNPGVGLRVENIAAWEAAHVGFDLSTYNSFFADNPKLIIIRLGENVSSLTGYQTSMEALIAKCQTMVPGCIVIVTGVFWTDPAKDAIHSAAASAKGVSYIPLSYLDIPENKSFMGAVVKGDDLADHVVDNSGVANHPGDLGMQRIADAIFSAI